MQPTREDRFWAKVDKIGHGGCWAWIPAHERNYGQFWTGERRVAAHRYSYELLVGPIPGGLVIDHLCRRPWCVNPAHLEPVTFRENVLRGEGAAAINARRTHCPQGHRLTPDNLYANGPSKKCCRTCRLARNRAWREKQVA